MVTEIIYGFSQFGDACAGIAATSFTSVPACSLNNHTMPHSVALEVDKV
jgi:hypothetical protein